MAPGALEAQLNPPLRLSLSEAFDGHAAALLQTGEEISVQALQPARDAQRSSAFGAGEGVEMPVARKWLRLFAQAPDQLEDEGIHAWTIAAWRARGVPSGSVPRSATPWAA